MGRVIAVKISRVVLGRELIDGVRLELLDVLVGTIWSGNSAGMCDVICVILVERAGGELY
jgi:hypothetical protein